MCEDSSPKQPKAERRLEESGSFCLHFLIPHSLSRRADKSKLSPQGLHHRYRNRTQHITSRKLAAPFPAPRPRFEAPGAWLFRLAAGWKGRCKSCWSGFLELSHGTGQWLVNGYLRQYRTQSMYPFALCFSLCFSLVMSRPDPAC